MKNPKKMIPALALSCALACGGTAIATITNYPSIVNIPISMHTAASQFMTQSKIEPANYSKINITDINANDDVTNTNANNFDIANTTMLESTVADTVNPDKTTRPSPSETEHTSKQSDMVQKLGLSARATYMIDAATGTNCFESNATTRYPIASMVKIMTLNSIFEAIADGRLKYDDQISVSQNAASMGGSQAFLDAGSSYPASELILAIIVASANDACVALSEHLSGSVDAFVTKMNETATKLGMTNTNFANCTGLPAPNGYSCAKDVATMMRELIKHDDFFKFSGIWMHTLKHPSGRTTELTNTNRLIRSYSGCDGGKTGFTNEAGSCIAATANKDNMRLIAVVMGASNSKARQTDATKLLNYGYSSFGVKHIANAGDVAGTYVLNGAKKPNVNAVYSKNVNVFGSRGSKAEITTKIEWKGTAKKVAKGDIVGKIYVARDGVVVDEIELISAETVGSKSFFDRIKDIFK